MQIRELIQRLDGILDPSSYRDYAPNGLQVQGRRDVKRLVTGVTASLDLIEAAAAQAPTPFLCTMAGSGRAKKRGSLEFGISASPA